MLNFYEILDILPYSFFKAMKENKRFLNLRVKKGLKVLLAFLCLKLASCNLYESQSHKEFEEVIEQKSLKNLFFFQLSENPLCFFLSEKTSL